MELVNNDDCQHLKSNPNVLAIHVRNSFVESYKKTNLGHKLVIETSYASSAINQATTRDMRNIIIQCTKDIS